MPWMSSSRPNRSVPTPADGDAVLDDGGAHRHEPDSAEKDDVASTRARPHRPPATDHDDVFDDSPSVDCTSSSEEMRKADVTNGENPDE